MNKKKKLVSPTLIKLRELRAIEYKKQGESSKDGKDKRPIVSLVGFEASYMPDFG